MKTLILLALMTISLNAVSQNNKSICVTLDPGFFVPGIQFNKMFDNKDFQASLELWPNKLYRIAIGGGFKIKDELSWLNAGIARTVYQKKEYFSLEVGDIIFIDKLSFMLSFDITLGYGKIGMGFNF